MKQNQYEEAVSPLALRTAVIGTKLESFVSLGGTYQEIKKEVPLAHGQQQTNFGDNLQQLHKGRSRSANGASEPLINYFNFFN